MIQNSPPRTTCGVWTGTSCSCQGSTRLASGSTSSQATAPTTHKAAASRKDAVHPNRAATNGVSVAVTNPPSCPPVFMNPETNPDDGPAIPAVTDQKELCDK